MKSKRSISTTPASSVKDQQQESSTLKESDKKVDVSKTPKKTSPPTAKPEEVSPLPSPLKYVKKDRDKDASTKIFADMVYGTAVASPPPLKSCLKPGSRTNSLGRNTKIRSCSPLAVTKVNFNTEEKDTEKKSTSKFSILHKNIQNIIYVDTIEMTNDYEWVEVKIQKGIKNFLMIIAFS